MNSLEGKTALITGASRGIGREIALKLAQAGVNIVIAAKSTEPQPKLSGTIYSVEHEIKSQGGNALALKLDVRDDDEIEATLEKAANRFGGLDILINNASAINLSNTTDLSMKRYDLMQNVNTRATFSCAKLSIPYLKKSNNPHIITLSPPINLNPKWFKNHLAYTISKYGMTMCTLGLAAEFKKDNIAINSLWPKTTIRTAAIENLFPQHIIEQCRKPSIVADAVLWIVSQKSSELTGQCLIDEEVLRRAGITDFSKYAYDEKQTLMTDLFLED